MSKSWSEREEKIFKQLWENEEIPYEDIRRVFVERTEKALEGKAKEMGLKPKGQRIKAQMDEAWLKKLLEVTEG